MPTNTTEKFQTIGGDRMVGPLGKVASPFRPTTRKRGRDRTTTIMRRDVGSPWSSSTPPSLGRGLVEPPPTALQNDSQIDQQLGIKDNVYLVYSISVWL